METPWIDSEIERLRLERDALALNAPTPQDKERLKDLVDKINSLKRMKRDMCRGVPARQTDARL